MSLETATYIHQLNAANPLGSDPIASGDDHIRLIKSAIKATFPNITGPVTATQDQLNVAVPAGGIIMWSGAANAIPSGWALCNGANGTPDLRGRFVIGAAGSYAVGASGGNSSITLAESQLPSHSHSASSTFSGNALGGHSHGISDPGHNHTGGTYKYLIKPPYVGSLTGGDYGGSGSEQAVGPNDGGLMVDATTGISINSASAGTPSGSVSTSISATGSGASIDIRNPYYALCFIMKV